MNRGIFLPIRTAIGYLQRWMNAERWTLVSISLGLLTTLWLQRRAPQIPSFSDLLNDPRNLDGFVTAARLRFHENGDIELIHEAVGLGKRAVELTEEGDPEFPGRLANLGSSLLTRYRRLGNLPDLEEAIASLRRAVELTTADDLSLGSRLTNLAASLESRCGHTGDVSDITEAVSLHRRSVQLMREAEGNGAHIVLPLMLTQLGNALSSQFERTGDLPALNEAISVLTQSMELTPPDHPDTPSILHSLGAAHHTRFSRTGDPADIAVAIHLKRRAIELTPTGHPALPSRLTNLGASLDMRFARTGSLPDIEESIGLRSRALHLLPEQHADQAVYLAGLGLSHRSRYTSLGDLTDIAEAISWHQLALLITPDDHAFLPFALGTLGSSFMMRYARTGDPSDLSEAVALSRRAIERTPEGHPEFAFMLSALGGALTMLFKLTGDVAHVRESIALRRRALDLIPNRHPSLPRTISDLGNTFLDLALNGGGPPDFTEAVSWTKKAVQLAPEGDSEFPALLRNAGVALRWRFEKGGGDGADIEEAISLLEKAVDLTPDGNPGLPSGRFNLGMAFYCKYSSPHGHPDDLVSAIRHLQVAATSPFGPPIYRLGAALHWARYLQRLSAPSPAKVIKAFDAAVKLVALVGGLETTVRGRYAQVQHVSGAIALEAAAVAFEYGRLDKSLEWLEEGRCLVWGQLTNLRLPLDDLRAHDSELAAKVAQAASQLDAIASSRTTAQIDMHLREKIAAEDEATKQLELAKEWDQLLGRVRTIQGFESFLLPSPCAALLKTLPVEGCVVVVNVNERRCDAVVLAVGMDGPLHIPLPDFSAVKANKLREMLQATLVGSQLRMREEDASAKEEESMRGIRPVGGFPRSILKRVLDGLWIDVAKPIVGALALSKVKADSEELPKRIWWCPTGALSFLPIHAAGVYGGAENESLLDYAVSSYIPTVTSLIHRVKKSRSVEHGPSGLLLTSQPAAPAAPRIHGTTREVQSIYDEAVGHGWPKALKFDGDEVSPEEFLQVMGDYSCVHLACHASQNAADPLASRFLFHKGTLDLHTIIQRNLKNADLAFLSACQTSAGEERLPDEAVHLAAGMLAAGYQRVVATMWSIKDAYAPDVAKDFYGHLWKMGARGEGFDGRLSAEALHFAVGRLRGRLGDTDQDLLAWIPYVHFGY